MAQTSCNRILIGVLAACAYSFAPSTASAFLRHAPCSPCNTLNGGLPTVSTSSQYVTEPVITLIFWGTAWSNSGQRPPASQIRLSPRFDGSSSAIADA
jgi:hypothetical protein